MKKKSLKMVASAALALTMLVQVVKMNCLNIKIIPVFCIEKNFTLQLQQPLNDANRICMCVLLA